LQNRLQMDEYQKSLNDLHQQYNVELKNTALSIKDAAKKLKGQIASWERLYVFRSPVKGRLAFFQVRKENQYVNAGAPIFMVVPNLEQYEIRAEVPIYKAGKIKIGERALIKLQQYPFEEFGMLQARVASITNVALDSNYAVGFSLVDGLKTTRKRNIDNTPEIFGTADIITKDKTILQRLFEGLYGQMHKE
jgi:multidrug resistance efflux pump